MTHSVWVNKLLYGDNKTALQSASLRDEIESAGGLKLVYIDPPFNVGKNFSTNDDDGKRVVAYSDKWDEGVDGYLTMMRERLTLIHKLLAEDGSIYLHCDYRVVAHLRLLMDDVFGVTNFLNHIIWKSGVGDTSAKNRKFIKTHDDILFYCKNKSSYIWNDCFQGYSESSLKLHKHKDEQGQYRYIPVDNPGGGGYVYDLGYGEKQPKCGYRMPIETAKKWIEEGTLLVEPNKVPSRKKYINDEGVRCQDIWTDISGSFRKGYPTQKPEKLLERIIKASSNEGDLVADFFCGSGTTLAVAERLGRRWIGCDQSDVAIKVATERLTNAKFEILQLDT